jgi:hypothetical protein
MGQMVDKKLDNSESFSEQASVHDVAVTHATRHFDHPSDQSFTGWLNFSVFLLAE